MKKIITCSILLLSLCLQTSAQTLKVGTVESDRFDARPVQCKPGDVFVATDTPFEYICDAGGASWSTVPFTSSNNAFTGQNSISAYRIDGIIYLDGLKYTTLATAVAALPSADIGGNTYQYGEIHVPPGDYTVTSVVTINSPYVTIIGSGSASSRITCATAGDCIKFANTPFTVYNGRGGLENLTLLSNGSSRQVGVHTIDMTVGFFLHDVVFDQFSGAGAIGWKAENAKAWTERTSIDRAWFNYCKTGIEVDTGGTNDNSSFGHQTWTDLQFNLRAGQTAISLNENAILYASTITGVVNAGDGGSATVFHLNDRASVASTVFLNLLVDLSGSTDIIGYDSPARTSFTPSGIFANYTASKCASNNCWIYNGGLQMYSTRTSVTLPDRPTVLGTFGTNGGPITFSDGTVNPPVEVGYNTATNSAGGQNLALNAVSSNSAGGQINEQIDLGDGNWGSGVGSVQGANIAHPIVWGYGKDPNCFEIYKKNYRAPLTPDARIATFPCTGGSSTATVSYIVASGKATLGAKPIVGNTCAPPIRVEAKDVDTSDVISWSFSADPNAVEGFGAGKTGMLSIWTYPTSNRVNFRVCNPTSAPITPAAAIVNWRVVR